MFRPPSISNRGSVAVNRDSLQFDTIPSQPRYVRDRNGLLKYVVDVDLTGVPKENLRITARQHVVLIDAKYDQVSENGDRTSHEVVREIHVPLTVDLNTVRCVYTTPGVLTIEAEASEPLPPGIGQHARLHQSRAKSPSRANSPADPRKVTFMEPSNSRVYSTEKFRQYLGPMRHLISPPPHFRPPPHPSSKRMSFQGRVHPVDSTDIRNSTAKVSSPSTSTKQHADRIRTPNYQPTRLLTPRSPLTPKIFRLRVDIGSHVEPNELSITRQNGVLLVHAKRYVKNKFLGRQRDRLVFEHRSEHTLPNDVDVNRLAARLENGTVYVDAPYIIPTRQAPPMGSPTLVRRDSKSSDISNNWRAMRPR